MVNSRGKDWVDEAFKMKDTDELEHYKKRREKKRLSLRGGGKIRLDS